MVQDSIYRFFEVGNIIEYKGQLKTILSKKDETSFIVGSSDEKNQNGQQQEINHVLTAEIFPVQLTTQWISKLGFKKRVATDFKEYWDMDKKRCDFVMVQPRERDDKSFICSFRMTHGPTQDGFRAPLIRQVSRIVRIMYVHELQNVIKMSSKV